MLSTIVSTVLVLIFTILSLVVSDVPQIEIEALNYLYDATDGSNWLWRNETGLWNFSKNVDGNYLQDPCLDRWQGICCSSIACATNIGINFENVNVQKTNIMGIILPEYRMRGIIPPRIFNISELTYLKLSNNMIFSTIPSEISSATNLVHLDLQDTLIEGTIPSQLGFLVQLAHLGVAATRIKGTIPPELGSLCKLKYLSLRTNSLVSPIPTELIGLLNLSTFDIGHNNFTGKIPEFMGLLTTLTELRLDRNRFTGSLPTSLSRLISLTQIDLDNNYISGSLPSYISSWQNLSLLDFSLNHLNGSLPSELGMLPKLKVLNLFTNSFSGMLPQELGMSSSIYQLYLNNNYLSGQLPSSLGMLTGLTRFRLAANSFSGTIPLSFAELTQLESFELELNALQGEIPEIFGNMRVLSWLYLTNNLFTGPVPHIFSSNKLSSYALGNNSLTGTTPCVIFNQSLLSYVDFSFNYMTGPICTPITSDRFNPLLVNLELAGNYFSGELPSTVALFSGLHVLDIGLNMLTGRIPTTIGLMTSLSYALFLDYNYLTGNICEELGMLVSLVDLELFRNLLTGELPVSISNMRDMDSIIIHSNMMSGSLEKVFTSRMSSLVTVDLSDNNFSGTVPVGFFMMEKLSVLVTINNCFNALPSNLCDYVTGSPITELAMDGMTAGMACQESLLFETYTTAWFMHGTIPNCLFQLPVLVFLQLSGNGFSGQLPGDIVISSSLKVLTLSHNRISGTIPTNFQEHHYHQLDLSYNKLSGMIVNMENFFEIVPEVVILNKTEIFVANSTQYTPQLTLQVNRLSGYLPDSFMYVPDIEVVNGNLFNCPLDSSFPKNDPGSDTTQCGSNDLNVALILWTTIAGMGILVYFYSQCCSVDNNDGRVTFAYVIHMVQAWSKLTVFLSMGMATCDGLSHEMIAQLQLTKQFFSLMSIFQELCVIFTGTIILVVMVFQIAIKYAKSEAFSTHELQYAYGPSLAFVSGQVPAIGWMIILMMIMILVNMAMSSLYLYTRRFNMMSFAKNAETTKKSMANSSMSTVLAKHDGDSRQKSLLSNSTFVNDSDDATVSQYQDETQSSASPGRNFWLTVDNRIVMFVLFPLADIVVILFVNAGYLYAAFNGNRAEAFSALIGLVAFKLFWNLWVLPRCIRLLEKYYLGLQGETSSGVLLACLMLFNNILSPFIITLCQDPNCFYNIFYQPQPQEVIFEYNSECQSGYCTGIAPVVERLSYMPPFIYGYQCSSAVLVNYVPVFVMMYLYLGLLQPCVYAFIMWLHCKFAQRRTSFLRCVGFRIMRHEDLLKSIDLSREAAKSDSNKTINKTLLNGRNITAIIICHVATLLTYGTAYPLLSVLICVAVAVEVVQWRVIVGRYLKICLATRDKKIQEFMFARLENSCGGIGGISTMVRIASGLLLGMMSLFFAFFLFDIASDKAHNELSQMIWAPLTVVLFPAIIWLCSSRLVQQLIRRLTCQPNSTRKDSIGPKDLNLSVLPSFRGTSFLGLAALQREYNEDENDEAEEAKLDNDRDRDRESHTEVILWHSDSPFKQEHAPSSHSHG